MEQGDVKEIEVSRSSAHVTTVKESPITALGLSSGRVSWSPWSFPIQIRSGGLMFAYSGQWFAGNPC